MPLIGGPRMLLEAGGVGILRFVAIFPSRIADGGCADDCAIATTITISKSLLSFLAEAFLSMPLKAWRKGGHWGDALMVYVWLYSAECL